MKHLRVACSVADGNFSGAASIDSVEVSSLVVKGLRLWGLETVFLIVFV